MSFFTDDIECERDKAMVSGKGEQECIHEHDVLEVVDQTLSVKEVVGAEQKVPIEGKTNNVRIKSRQNTTARVMSVYSNVPVRRSEPGQLFLLARHVGKVNDFLVDQSLHHDDQQDHKGGSCSHTGKEAANHDQGPQRSNGPVVPLCLCSFVRKQDDSLEEIEKGKWRLVSFCSFTFFPIEKKGYVCD